MKTLYTQEEALKKMRSGKNIFLTGLPGTGKSYITRQFIQEKEAEGKQVLVCAPTGIAALNLNGVTMHQAFSIPIPAYGHYITEITNSKVKTALTADIIIIDEISMCRNDVFEYFGYVIDYIGLNIFGYKFPIFNFADICIVVSVILIFVSMIKGDLWKD